MRFLPPTNEGPEGPDFHDLLLKVVPTRLDQGQFGASTGSHPLAGLGTIG
jgi:hypothetical protein